MRSSAGGCASRVTPWGRSGEEPRSGSMSARRAVTERPQRQGARASEPILTGLELRRLVLSLPPAPLLLRDPEPHAHDRRRERRARTVERAVVVGVALVVAAMQ